VVSIVIRELRAYKSVLDKVVTERRGASGPIALGTEMRRLKNAFWGLRTRKTTVERGGKGGKLIPEGFI
jgi:hypothetical protein